jgi:hypothetical protein
VAALSLTRGLITADATPGGPGVGRLVRVPAASRRVLIEVRPTAGGNSPQPRGRLRVQCHAVDDVLADGQALGTQYITVPADTIVVLTVPLWATVAGWSILLASNGAAPITVEYLAEE